MAGSTNSLCFVSSFPIQRFILLISFGSVFKQLAGVERFQQLAKRYAKLCNLVFD